MPIDGTGRFANRRLPSWLNSSPLPPSDTQNERRRPKDGLLADPTSDLLIDFNSNEGFVEAAKKKTKAKTPSAPPPPPPPPAAPPADDGQKDDNVGSDGGASGGDSAGGAGDGNDGSNGSNGGNGPPPKPPTTFENINLGGEDKQDNGLNPPENKGISSSWGAKLGFGGGGWGWGGSGKSQSPPPPPPAPAPPETKAEDNPWDKSKDPPDGIDDEDDWGFGTKKKKEKQPSTLWGAEPDAEPEPKVGDDPWGWSGQKKKGKAGGILEELDLEPEPAGAGGRKDIWDTWGISKKDRAKKKGIMESVALAAAPDPPSMEDQWGGWSGKKDTNQSSLWGSQDGIPAPAPDPPSFEDKNDGDDFWSTFGTGKAKPVEESSGGWGLLGGLGKKGEDEICESNFSKAHHLPEPPKIQDDGWDLWGTGKKKKKAGDLIQLEDEVPPPAPDPVEAVGTDDFLDSWGFGKKPKKPDADPFDFKTSGADVPNDASWGSIDNQRPSAHDFLIDTTGKMTLGAMREVQEVGQFTKRR